MSTNTMLCKLSVSCRCGQFNASVEIEEKSLPSRLKCYCIDCQSYVQHLNQADIQLDKQGGTELIQLSPAQFSITAGQEYLSNLMLSPSGIYRWYATCCQTPICNTTTKAEMPYVGLITNNISKVIAPKTAKLHQPENTGKAGSGKHKTLNDDNREARLLEVFGPIKFGICAGDKHPLKAAWPISKGFGFRGLFGTLRVMGRWRLRGDHKRSIFIDIASGKPLVEPSLISKEQRQAAKNAVMARSSISSTASTTNSATDSTPD